MAKVKSLWTSFKRDLPAQQKHWNSVYVLYIRKELGKEREPKPFIFITHESRNWYLAYIQRFVFLLMTFEVNVFRQKIPPYENICNNTCNHSLLILSVEFYFYGLYKNKYIFLQAQITKDMKSYEILPFRLNSKMYKSNFLGKLPVCHGILRSRIISWAKRSKE